MHELAVTESLLNIALKHAETAGAQSITDLYLVIGQLSSIVDDSVQFYWDMISQDTIAAGSQLHFRRIQAEMLCLECDNRFVLNGNDFACPVCGQSKVQLVSGDEFFVEAIDVVETPT